MQTSTVFVIIIQCLVYELEPHPRTTSDRCFILTQMTIFRTATVVPIELKLKRLITHGDGFMQGWQLRLNET